LLRPEVAVKTRGVTLLPKNETCDVRALLTKRDNSALKKKEKKSGTQLRVAKAVDKAAADKLELEELEGQIANKKIELAALEENEADRWAGRIVCFCLRPATDTDVLIVCAEALPVCPARGQYHRSCIFEQSQIGPSPPAAWTCGYCTKHNKHWVKNSIVNASKADRYVRKKPTKHPKTTIVGAASAVRKKKK
jgi:hypothetical protein